MVDTELERQIAKSLIRREFSERFLRELQAPGNTVIHKLPRMVEDRLVVGHSEGFVPPADIVDTMRKNNVGSMCYIFSEFDEFHRAYVPLRTALEAMEFSGFPAFVVGLPSGFSYLKGTAYTARRFSCFIQPFRGFDRIP